MEDNLARETEFPVGKLKKIGMLEPESRRRSSLSSSVRFVVEGDQIYTVEVPRDERSNIIKKPFAEVKSLLGQAILLSEATKSAGNT